ncbi:MAG: hypothetical protein WCW16_02910 [Candidatus Magasanikbacteria bacterium]
MVDKIFTTMRKARFSRVIDEILKRNGQFPDSIDRVIAKRVKKELLEIFDELRIGETMRDINLNLARIFDELRRRMVSQGLSQEVAQGVTDNMMEHAADLLMDEMRKEHGAEGRTGDILDFPKRS